MSAKKVIKRIIIVFMTTLVAVLMMGTGAFLYLRNQGREGLKKVTQSNVPSMAGRGDAADGKGADAGAKEAGDGASGSADASDTNADGADTYALDDPSIIEYNGAHYRYNDDIITFLIMGVDSLEKVPPEREDVDYTMGGQADALFLLVINPDEKRGDMIAVNRNAMGEVDMLDKGGNPLGTELMQVCLAHGFGTGRKDSCERETATISKLMFDLPIHGYVAIQMGAIPVINDVVGGVTLEVLEDIPRGSNALKNGQGKEVTLMGQDAYHYVQYRDTKVFDSASKRMERQKQYMKLLMKKILSSTKEDISFPISLLGAANGYVVTDIDVPTLTYIATSCASYDYNLDEIYSLEGKTVTGLGDLEEFYVDDDALYDLIINLFYEKTD